jgi:tetratricopeptide (TPR) repeat protein
VTSRHQPKKRPAKSPRKAALKWVSALAIVVAAVVAIVAVYRHSSPAPPKVSLSSLDRNLASLIETSRAAVIAAPRSASAWGKLGQGFHAAEFRSEAMFCYSNAMKFDAREPRWPYLLGALQLRDRPDSALQYLSRATELAGTNETPRYAFAHALVAQGRFDEARPHLELLVAANPAHAAAHLDLARLFLARNQIKEASRALESPLTNNFTERHALLLAAQLAQRNNQPDLASQLSRKALATPRGFDWPDVFIREVKSLRADRVALADNANALLQQKRLPETEAALDQLFASFPNDAEGLLLLGRLRYLQQRCAEAEKIFRESLQQQPDSLNALVQLGMALMCLEQWTNAAAVLERAVTLKPDFGAAHHNLGVARSRAGDIAGSIKAFRDALRCTPGDVNALIALAEELANAGQVAEAIECVKRAEELAPNEPRLARAREQLGIK